MFPRQHRTALHILAIAVAGALLPGMALAAPALGTLLNSNFLSSYPRDVIAVLVKDDQPLEQPKCNVRLAEFTYATVGVNGEPTTASAAMLVREARNVRGPIPCSAGATARRRCGAMRWPRTSAMPRAMTRW